MFSAWSGQGRLPGFFLLSTGHRIPSPFSKADPSALSSHREPVGPSNVAETGRAAPGKRKARTPSFRASALKPDVGVSIAGRLPRSCVLSKNVVNLFVPSSFVKRLIMSIK